MPDDVTGIDIVEGTGIDVVKTTGPSARGTKAEYTISTTGAPPTGAAGGVLSGTYPNPGFAVDMATQAELDAFIAIVEAGGPGHWELVMADGVTAPPVPVETEAQDDWVYAYIED